MLTCASCGHANTAQSNFCSHCGAPLPQTSTGGETTTMIAVNADEAALEDLSPEDEAAVSSLPQGSALLVAQRGRETERFLLNSPSSTVGRHPKADLFLDDVTVSRHHAEFIIEDGELKLRDLGSLNGTYVNRKVVDGTVSLKTGDQVQIGKFRMTAFVSPRGLK